MCYFIFGNESMFLTHLWSYSNIFFIHFYAIVFQTLGLHSYEVNESMQGFVF